MPLSQRVQVPSVSGLPEALRQAAVTAAQTLRLHGHRAWLVGGCVRDLALGRTPGDADLCSDATPSVVQAAFTHTVPVGIEFGTVLVVLEPGAVEHTTYRTEGTYSDGRRPDRVSFGRDLAEDARRRDFTVNALYLDPLTDEVCDPEGGLADLQAGLLRAIGDPVQRFQEDALRLLRLVRFGAVLGFSVEAQTEAAARRCAPLLAGMARERVHKELTAVAARGDGERFLTLLERCGLVETTLGLALPQVAERARLMRAWPHQLGLGGWLAALAAPLGEESPALVLERAERLAQGLKCSGEEQAVLLDALQLVCELQQHLEPAATPPSRAVRVRWARRVGQRCAWELVCRLQPESHVVRTWRAEAENWTEAEVHPAPYVRAADLLQLGVARGPRLGELLRALETAQLDGVVGDREAALRFVRQQL